MIVDLEPENEKICLVKAPRPMLQPDEPPQACFPPDPDDLIPYTGAGGMGGVGGTGGAGGAGGGAATTMMSAKPPPGPPGSRVALTVTR